MLRIKRNSIPIWKKIFSFFYPFRLESSVDPYFLELILDNNILKLNSENANQSNENLKKAFDRLFQMTNIYKRKNQSLLLYGLGLGSVIELLDSRNQLRYVNTIENDQRVIEWIENYYDLGFSINAPDCDKYNMIIVDLFVDNQMPDILNKLDFWTDLKLKLNPNGILIWNTLLENSQNAEFDLSDCFTSKIDIINLNRFWIYKT